MSASLACVLLLQGLSAALGKYVHVPTPMEWSDAQSYCERHYTDLAPVSVPHDIKRFYQIVPDDGSSVWIGLMRNPLAWEQWMWSGAGIVSRTFWEDGQPSHLHELSGWMQNGKWHDAPHDLHKTFACFNVTVVREKKSWEGALEHCRRHHRDLASVASNAEMLLIQKELEESGTSEAVWTGLRMLGKNWLWVDKQPLQYQAWGAKGRPTCPTRRCGTLRLKTKTSVDLDSDATMDWSTEVYGSNTDEWEWQTEWETDWKWAAEDCAEKNYFICY